MSYSEFIENLLIIKNIYKSFNLDIDIETENKMEQYLINQRNIKKQKHSYSLEEFGLSENKISDHLKDYIINNDF